MREELWETDGVNVMLSLAVCHHDRDEVLCHMTPVPPRLPESQEEIWGGRMSLHDSVVLQSGAEVVGVIKDPCGPILAQLGCFFCRRWGP